ncbi:MAG TPA: hypothetical protein PLP19_21215 [bacterium]|nr:hypothetical protein [bacterium]HPN46017.1 hypothetical protein [bacterium]
MESKYNFELIFKKIEDYRSKDDVVMKGIKDVQLMSEEINYIKEYYEQINNDEPITFTRA